MLNRSSHFIFLCSSKLLRNGKYNNGVFLSKGLARKDTSSPDPRSEANSPWTWRCGGWTMWANSSRCWRCAKSAFPFAQMILLVFVSVCVCVCVSEFACICQEHGDRCCDRFVEWSHLTEQLIFWEFTTVCRWNGKKESNGQTCSSLFLVGMFTLRISKNQPVSYLLMVHF